jgi:hypothetical protein
VSWNRQGLVFNVEPSKIGNEPTDRCSGYTVAQFYLELRKGETQENANYPVRGIFPEFMSSRLNVFPFLPCFLPVRHTLGDGGISIFKDSDLRPD